MFQLLFKPTLKLMLLSWVFALGISPAIAGVMVDLGMEAAPVEAAGEPSSPGDAPLRFSRACEPWTGMVEVERTGGGAVVAVLSSTVAVVDRQPRSFCSPAICLDLGGEFRQEIFRPT